MIINIDDTTNLKRIILEFDESSNNSDEEINIINSNANSNSTNKTIKPKSRKTTKQDDNDTETSMNVDNTDVPIDFNNYLESTETSNNLSSQEIIQKPVIPDINRDIKIADNMQNLKI